MKPTLSDQDFKDAAASLGCQEAAIRAVCKVEAPRGGFNPDDSVVTLFEGHKFYKFTNGRFAVQAPDLCYPRWTRQYYGKNWGEERERLARAIELDEKAALMSASWGKFQIMGFNFSMVGFDTVNQFVAAMESGEPAQLKAFVQFVRTAGLAPSLRRLDWAGFAHGYNGPAYAENDYDGKLALAYFGFAP
ncbi:MAG: N-acetylmuramidase family protein [Rhodoferax sp.]